MKPWFSFLKKKKKKHLFAFSKAVHINTTVLLDDFLQFIPTQSSAKFHLKETLSTFKSFIQNLVNNPSYYINELYRMSGIEFLWIFSVYKKLRRDSSFLKRVKPLLNNSIYNKFGISSLPKYIIKTPFSHSINLNNIKNILRKIWS